MKHRAGWIGMALFLAAAGAEAGEPKLQAKPKTSTNKVGDVTELPGRPKPAYRWNEPRPSRPVEVQLSENATYVEGRIERIEDGALVYSIDNPALGVNATPAERAKLAPRVEYVIRIDPNKVSLAMINNRMGQDARLEIRRDRLNFTYVTDVLTPKSSVRE